jgi:putative peptidoglycan lipid II flippase
MRRSLAVTLRGVVFLALPASLGLILLRQPIVAMLFQRGAFSAESTDLVAFALLWYSAGLVSHSLVEIVSRAFYALQDTKTPVILGSLAMGLNIVMSLAFASLFRRWGLPPHGGLALANSLATTLEAIGLLVLMRRRLAGLDFQRMRRGLLATAAAAITMSLILAAWLNWAQGQSAWLAGGLGVLVGGIVFWLVAWALGSPETTQLPRMLLTRRRSQLGSLEGSESRHQDLGDGQAEQETDQGFDG